MAKMAKPPKIDQRRMASCLVGIVEVGHSTRVHECQRKYDGERGLLEGAMSLCWLEDAVVEVEVEAAEGDGQVWRPEANACHCLYRSSRIGEATLADEPARQT